MYLCRYGVDMAFKNSILICKNNDLNFPSRMMNLKTHWTVMMKMCMCARIYAIAMDLLINCGAYADDGEAAQNE